MAHTDPDHAPEEIDLPPMTNPADPSLLDPVAASEPTEMPTKRPNWLVRFFSRTNKASGGPAGPTEQTGGMP